MNRKDVQKFIYVSKLADSDSIRNRKLAAGPKSQRRVWIITDPETEEGQICAAIEIQRTWRGYRSRCRLFQILHPKVSDVAMYGQSRHHLMRDGDFQDQEEEPKTKGRLKLEEYYKNYVEKLRAAGLSEMDIASFEDFCANYIQNWWAMVRRADVGMSRDEDIESPPLTRPTSVDSKKSAPPPPPPQKKKLLEPLSPGEAATMIQKAWRRHIDIQVYRYYRDLISFKTRGDPTLMLRCINPNEAKMLDPAAGIHIRFRLAGMKFPPNIYYKIFTHRPIVDMCANSPKDYTKPSTKNLIMKDVHNKGGRVKYMDKSGWYERVENNGWRLVSDRLIHHIMNDPVTWETSKKKIDFHHNKLQRKQDLEKKKKTRKIEWMQRMYKDGMLKAKSDDKETIRLIEGAAAGMVASVERGGPEALEEWEVDELLDWTTSLNFDEYMTSWKELATSANSEKCVEDRLQLVTTGLDPYEMTISMGPSRQMSTRQSLHENTPVSSMGHMKQPLQT